MTIDFFDPANRLSYASRTASPRVENPHAKPRQSAQSLAASHKETVPLQDRLCQVFELFPEQAAGHDPTCHACPGDG